ncbi:aldo/keto reductase [Flavobacterium sp. 7A]|uniref:aldo/keto reductase n=1 Tax=Flavobacterium sp. 7A TaxID=2940571 RepID=UPI0022261E6D|nr:aldo/keto reductase [Flavobacterium sp. 7A]MCW2120349.1 aryl-alcohol dehydrogenase-like predicted oxidoreductase [Flavobacterium sp. 7A]
MKYNKLPQTDLKVSEVCLGTMTFGQQNSEAEGHAQMDFALDQGINFFDTAEMYSIPSHKETYGSTEKIIGSWFKKSGKREKVVLASKIVGPSPSFGYMREKLDFSPTSLQLALENSLKRLQTDHIDLYQLHWPERKTNFFGQHGFQVQTDEWQDNIHEVLVTLDGFVKSGKIKAIGVSNENPWGLMRFLEESKYNNLPRISTVQNPYSLLNRQFEVGSAEICHRENVGLLSYSPLGFGVLTGKFLEGLEKHPKARLNLFPQYNRYSSEQSIAATKMYHQIAIKNGLTLTQLALAFINQQQYVTSTIIGATSIPQLKENIEAFSIRLSEDILKEVDAVQAIFPNPAP